MIRINLLPEATKKGTPKRVPGGKAPSNSAAGGGMIIGLLAFVLFGTAGAMAYYVASSIGAAEKEHARVVAEQKSVETKINSLSDKAKEIQRLMEVFTKQAEVLKALDPPDQILWSEKINMLAQLMPSDVFLTDLDVSEQIVEVETQASVQAQLDYEKNGKVGPKPEVVKKPVVTYTLKLTGLATGDDSREQFANVLTFEKALRGYQTTDNLKRDRRFMQYFNEEISIDFIEATLYENQYPVNQFVFVLKSLPQTSEESSEGALKPLEATDSSTAAPKKVGSARTNAVTKPVAAK